MEKREENDLIASLLDQYMVVLEDPLPVQEPSPVQEPVPTPVPVPSPVQAPSRIEYPKTSLHPAADCFTNMYTSLIDEDATNKLSQLQIQSLHQTRLIRRDLRKANESLREMYPVVKGDVERCMDLLTKIHVDREAIDASCKRSQNMLQKFK